MGYSIPAAMGAKLADRKRQVVAVCGDGSFQMSMMEFATMRQENVPCKVVVLKNGYLGMVREYQQFTYKENYSVVELNDYPNLELLSKAYGINYIKVNNNSEIDKALDKFLENEDSYIMEVSVNPFDIVRG